MNVSMITSFVRGAGLFGPLVYVLVQIIQTVIAPLPGALVGPIGGFLFGWWGVLWTTIGSTLGALTVLIISRKVGRKLILRILKRDKFKTFDNIPNERLEAVIFLLILIPGLPDDTICYAAGLTKIPIKKLILYWVIGRFPSVVVSNYIGMGVEKGQIKETIVILGVVALILGFVAVKREAIIKAIRSGKTTKNKKKKKVKRKSVSRL